MADFDFSTLITDRGQSDLATLRSVLSTPMEEWTAEQLAAFNLAASKGAYNYTDLNRVTAAMDAIHERLTALGYQTGYHPIIVHPATPPEPVGPLPEGYKQLEYIQSSGTQWINTEFYPKYNSRIMIDIESLGSTPQFVFGTRNAASARAEQQFNIYRNSGATIRSDYFGTNVTLSISDASVRTIIDKNGNTVTMFGQTATNTPVTSGVCTYPLYLFTLNNAGKIDANASFKLYSCKIYDNETLVRDFLPCINLSGAVGLYDLVEQEFYGNSGTGVFAAGPETRMAAAFSPAPEPEPLDPYTWYETDDPKISQMMQYLSNLVNLCNVLTLEPKLPEQIVNLTTDGANQIEEALSLLWQTIQQVVNGFARSNCFTFWSGSRPIPCP